MAWASSGSVMLETAAPNPSEQAILALDGARAAVTLLIGHVAAIEFAELAQQALSPSRHRFELGLSHGPQSVFYAGLLDERLHLLRREYG